MDILKLKGQNFLTLGKFELELDNRGLLLIQGENGDDPSADSNGAGKSSILDAICWAIYGVTARGVSTDAIINKTAKKDCVVEVVMQDAGKEYRITRHRKHATNKNAVLVTERDLASGASADLSKGTDKETQEVINAIMGCSLDVFMAAVYSGQESAVDLPGMTDKQLKLLIEEAAGVEVLSGAYSLARDRAAKAASMEADLTAKITTVGNNIAILTGQVADMQSQHDTFEAARKTRAQEKVSEAKPHAAKMETLKKELAAYDEAALISEVAELNAKIAAQDAMKAEARELNNAVLLADREKTKLAAELTNGQRDIKNREATIANIDAKVGTPCSECGKEYHEEDLGAAKTAQATAIASVKSGLALVAAKYKSAVETLETAQKAVSEHAATIPDLTAVVARLNEVRKQQATVETCKRGIESLKAAIAVATTAARNCLSEANPYTVALNSKKDDLSRMEAALPALQAELEAAQAEAELTADAVKVFGPAGVRAHILDTVTPFLNERTSEYLGALSDGSIHATWNTLTKTAKGELREKFNIDVANDKGAESFAGLSGGEKRKVRLSTAMALQDMVASRATKPLGILIADEIDNALDESGLERLMGVLDRKARERGTVLVVSHNSLSDWIPEVITVTKTAGASTVSGAIAREI